MADALVSALLETVLGILSSALLEETSLFWDLKDELNRLESTFDTIQLVLHDAELKQRKNEPIQNWLRKLKNVASDAENVLDRIATQTLTRRAVSERGTYHRLKSFPSSRNPLLFRMKMAREVKNIRRKLDGIAEERHKFHLEVGVVENRFGVTLESRITSSLVNESEIIGRREEKEAIVEKVLDDGTYGENDVSVYAIQGMGGLGKTTLVQMVYNDERIKRCFELRIWVCVSDDFSVWGILRAILESIEGGGCSVSSLDPLQRRLQERLRGRRYLLVLDDVWNENYKLWDELKEVLSCGSKGSMLIVTTRIEKVATMMAQKAIHIVNYLSSDDSWSLFRRRAFMDGEREGNFISIGKGIVKKCGGVPLAIKALGSLMRFKSDEREWLAIKESEIWHLSDDDNGILPALRLSYDNLSPRMRQCFSYCCIFPKDYLMEENQLIQLWMANGYIPLDNGTNMHLAGHLIFKELVWRSFLQDVEINSRGNMICKMHDLLHDLASSVMKHETYILEYNKKLEIPKTLRHLSFDSGSSSWDMPDDKSTLKLPIDHSLRSVIVHAGNVPAWRKGFYVLLSKQKYLRALDIRPFSIGKLPDFIYRLEHLRYLAMACYNMKRLPESLTHLCNLQTLKLTNSEMLLELPKGMKVMRNLWFLEIENYFSLLCTPPGLGNLTCLRRLSIFIVGEDGPHQIDQLKDLDLEGELSIHGLDKVRNLQDARSTNLMTKSYLTSLNLSWKKGIKKKSAEHFEEVLEGLQPHQNLEKISITSYHGSTFPKWMSTVVFAKLKEISLDDCPRCERLPPFGKLPSLTCLCLNRMDSIKCLDTECYGDRETSFPSLTSLKVSCMPNFERWAIADSSKSFPCLECLDMHLCPKLVGLPKLPTIRSLFITSSNATLLKSVTYLTSLKSLIIFAFPELDIFPEGLLQNQKVLEVLQVGSLPIRTLSNMFDGLSSLKTLHLDHCSNLEFFPEDFNFSSLEELDIRGCDALRSFTTTSLHCLSSLRSLSFQNCEKLNPLVGPLGQAAPNLHRLLLNKLPKMEHLPESVQLFRSLRELRIYHCEGLCSLPNWLGSLESLSVIGIFYCEKLNYLPDCVKGLKSLRMLDIRGCSQLAKRCKKLKGEDWWKISHIPIIRIDQKGIQHLD